MVLRPRAAPMPDRISGDEDRPTVNVSTHGKQGSMHRHGASAQGDNRREYPSTTAPFSAGETLRSWGRRTGQLSFRSPAQFSRAEESLFVCSVRRVFNRRDIPSSSAYIFTSLICTIGSISV